MDREIVQACIEQAHETYSLYASCALTKRAAYGLAVHTLMYLATVDAKTACLLFPEPESCLNSN